MELSEFFQKYPKVALAFSGGVDSAYLLYAAIKENAEVQAYYVKSSFQPQFELEDAKRLAEQLHARYKILDLDVLSDARIAKNPADRCYYCKKRIFEAILDAARQDGFSVLIDGTNASDDAGDRPGMRALRELSVHSPLRECGITKEEVRKRSKEAGLFTWNKPAYACLATRISSGTGLTERALRVTETAEAYLSSLGFTDFRIRILNNAAKIQIPEEQFPKIFAMREKVTDELRKYYDAVLLDMEARG